MTHDRTWLVDFYHAIVELVDGENIAWLIKGPWRTLPATSAELPSIAAHSTASPIRLFMYSTRMGFWALRAPVPPATQCHNLRTEDTR